MYAHAPEYTEGRQPCIWCFGADLMGRHDYSVSTSAPDVHLVHTYRLHTVESDSSNDTKKVGPPSLSGMASNHPTVHASMHLHHTAPGSHGRAKLTSMSPTSSTVGRGGNSGFAACACEPLASALAPFVLLFLAEAPSAAPFAPISCESWGGGVVRSVGTKQKVLW